MIGFHPARASNSAQNNPQGPVPTTTGRHAGGGCLTKIAAGSE
jgi:hypothetical protein